ncbi:uncharacterized protein LOC107605534 isoform X2 [Arachis ipaensis]|uniref:uncharacterized protein LOC107605534 isoform X2 n=1 Tax=Arachis ipaensis TaxID=130454 RepID=UPI000A2B0600|nr:uncharacterized protein LOC107605534 isoform X2 [Arachis ipaensis]XP_025660099.1 uncharacterized protein LOC112755957 isoform X2 [Arachis hypogaea]
MSEDAIWKFCNALASFCNHLQSNSDALKLSIDRRPIPLDSASSTFVQSLNRRVSTSAADLELLDSMSFGTVSFEELLGHCNELYKKNHSDLLELEDRLKSSYGYVPDFEDEEDDEEEEGEILAPVPDSSFNEDDLFDESMSLKQLGLSDACLATLASGEPEKEQEFKQQQQPVVDKIVASEGRNFLSDEANKENLESAEPSSSLIKISEREFECLPGYMKGLATWEDLVVAVDKINSSLRKKTNGGNYFRQDEIPSFDLGPKARSYLLVLVRMNRLVVETIDGILSYRVL